MDVPFEEIVDQLGVGVVFVNKENRIVYCNEAEARIRGIGTGRLLGQSLQDCHSPKARARVEALSESFRNGHNPGFVRMNDRDAKFVEQWFKPLFDPTGAYLGMLLVSIDVTVRESSRRRLEVVATRDALTGLFSKNYFTVIFAGYQEQLGHDLAGLALMMADVNGLKAVNDSLGHEAGDRLITKAGELMRRSLRSSDLVFRFGGDEFVALLPGGDEKAAQAAYRRIKAACKRWTAEHPELPLGLAVGWSAAKDREDSARMFSLADERMYRDKRRTKAKAAARRSG